MIHQELLSGSRLITREDVLTNQPFLDAADFQYRADIIRPLTQTCRVLRNVYLARYYEQVEACVVRESKAWYKELSHRLEMTSKGLAGSPELAKHVRCAKNVSLVAPRTDILRPGL